MEFLGVLQHQSSKVSMQADGPGRLQFVPGVDLEATQEFMATMVAMGYGPIPGHSWPDLKQWSHTRHARKVAI